MTENPKKQLSIIEHFLTVGGVVAASFFAFALICAVALIYWPKSSGPVAQPEPVVVEAFTDDEIRAEILEVLEKFLKAKTTSERLDFVFDPEVERAALADHYVGRGNRDLPLASVKFIKPVTLDGRRLWIVSYLDSLDEPHLLSFERQGNRFLIHWSASHAYGDLPWEKFSAQKPSEPTAMRAFLLRHDGPLPPGYLPEKWSAFVVEDDKGAFTEIAMIDRNSEDFALLDETPEGARLPVNVELVYAEGPNGIRQLIIHRLIHFQWLGPSIGKGEPLRRGQKREIPNF